MKKLFISVGVVAALVAAFIYLRRQRSLLEEPGRIEAVAWGKITLPITASGVAKEARRVEIKSKASGTILKIPVSEGDLVKKGDLLIEIDEKDERQLYNQAQVQVDRAQANLRRLKIIAQQVEKEFPLKVAKAEAALEGARQRHAMAKFEYERIERLMAEGQETEREHTRAKTGMLDALAELATAEVNVATAKLGELDVDRARQEVIVAEKDLEIALEQLRERQTRLEETKIRSPIDGRVVRIQAAVGLVVGSTITSFAGGATLLELVDTSEVIVEAQVDEADIDRVNELLNVGRLQEIGGPAGGPAATSPPDLGPNEVLVRFDALREEQFVGRIVDIAQEPRDIANVITYDVRIILKDSPDLPRVRLGMQGTVEFRPTQAEGLLVPYGAVHRRGPGDFVAFVPTDKALREEKEVPIGVGLSDGMHVIVTSGLKAGDKVYVKRPTRFGREDKDVE